MLVTYQNVLYHELLFWTSYVGQKTLRCLCGSITSSIIPSKKGDRNACNPYAPIVRPDSYYLVCEASTARFVFHAILAWRRATVSRLFPRFSYFYRRSFCLAIDSFSCEYGGIGLQCYNLF